MNAQQFFRPKTILNSIAAPLFAAIIISPVVNLQNATASESSALAMLKSPRTGDSTLNKMRGKWRGNGKILRKSNGKAEAANCRFTNNWAAGKKLVHLRLACRGTDINFSAQGYLGRSGSRYRGEWGTNTGHSATMSGSGGGGSVNLTLTPTSPADAPKSRLSFKVSGSRVTAKLTAKDKDTGKRFTVFQSILKK